MLTPSKKNYTVVSTGTMLRCIDATTGNLVNTHRIDGTMVSGPVVTGDRVTLVVRKGNTNTGYVLKVPSLLRTSTFRA